MMTIQALMISDLPWNLAPGTESFHLLRVFMIIMITAALACFIVSEITRNYSQVDKVWSLMPLVYSFTALASDPSPRLWIMSALITIWGARLTYNFYRKGGYSIIPWKGEEDYRWNFVRQYPLLKGRIRFGLFNLLFISIYQHLLIMLFSSPLLLAAQYNDRPLAITDLAASVLMLLFIAIETIADNQQHRFQKLKKQGVRPEGLLSDSLKRGFLSEGLWQHVRHPNFAAEQAIWISFYLFGVSASGLWLNRTLTGPVLLVLLFTGSTWLTEKISSSKYPTYAAYKSTVPGFIPRIFRKAL